MIDETANGNLASGTGGQRLEEFFASAEKRMLNLYSGARLEGRRIYDSDKAAAQSLHRECTRRRAAHFDPHIFGPSYYSSLNQARVAISSLATLQAQRPGAVAALHTAQLELSYTGVYAPYDGQVVGLNISEGAYAHAGIEVFTFLDSRKWYVLANFRERELQSIRPRMRAEVYLLSNPDRRFEGTVQGISPAVQSQEDNVEVKGLPFVKRDLNWVRIAQRFAVRIEIENPDPNIFRMGTTAVTTIRGFIPPKETK